MTNLQKELDELMHLTKVNGQTRQVIRRHFSELEFWKKKEFVENIQWEVIKTTNKNNYKE